jgi:hypothetical protein
MDLPAANVTTAPASPRTAASPAEKTVAVTVPGRRRPVYAWPEAAWAGVLTSYELDNCLSFDPAVIADGRIVAAVVETALMRR